MKRTLCISTCPSCPFISHVSSCRPHTRSDCTTVLRPPYTIPPVVRGCSSYLCYINVNPHRISNDQMSKFHTDRSFGPVPRRQRINSTPYIPMCHNITSHRMKWTPFQNTQTLIPAQKSGEAYHYARASQLISTPKTYTDITHTPTTRAVLYTSSCQISFIENDI